MQSSWEAKKGITLVKVSVILWERPPKKYVAIEAKEHPGKRSQALSSFKIQTGLVLSEQPAGWPDLRSFQEGQRAPWRLGFVTWLKVYWPHSSGSESCGSASATS